MADIVYEFPIKANPDKVFAAVSSPAGLDYWWTKRSAGTALEGAEYELWFGPEYDWRARVVRCIPGSEFEIELVEADADWRGTRVGFRLEVRKGGTWIQFWHTGWPAANEHYRVSCFCWAMYLRLLRRYIEFGETVEYEERLDA